MAKEGNLAQKTYQQISAQNGSTFAQMLKKYDKEILNIPGIVDILKYAGKDAVGTLFFLDTLKEDPDAFEKFKFSPSSIPYFDDELVEAFIQKAEEIRATEDYYPKSAPVAQEILESYKEKRRNKLAKINGVSPDQIKETELFVPTKEEKEAYPDTSFIEYGNPSYAIFYLLNTLVSSEIEYKKKKGDGISQRDLTKLDVRSELAVSLQKFMGKYHYHGGKLFRFNMEKNGVYFMDEDVLKEGKVLSFNSKRYFQMDGLIVDIQTNQVINLAGVNKSEEEALLNQIKDKKLSIKEEKNTRILMAGDKELFVAREGKRLSVYDLICRQKGKKYAEWLRQGQVLDVPNLVDVVEYASHSMDGDVLEYLSALKPKIQSKIQSPLNPIVHLFMAGYIPCYSPELTEKYTKLANKIVPIDEKAPWDKKATIPEEIAIRLAQGYMRDKRNDLAEKRGCSVDEISDLDVLCVTSLAEQNMIKPYYRLDEEICTLRSQTRFQEQYMINAVKRNISDIKREKFKDPERDDEYGTSCISIQIPVRGGNLDIKNRYNHTIYKKNPDKTFNANPDAISKGLLSALEREIPVEFNTSEAVIPYGHVPFGVRLFKYKDEVHGIYFSDTHYLRNGVVHSLKEGWVLNNGLFILPNGEILNKNYSADNSLKDALRAEFRNKKVEIKTNEAGVTTLYANGDIVATIKEGEFVTLCLKEAQQLGHGFMNHAPLLEELRLPNVMYIPSNVLASAPSLKRLDIPRCIYADSDFLKEGSTAQMNAPMIFERGTSQRLKRKPLTSSVAFTITQYLSNEFKDKKVEMNFDRNGFYHIYANGREVASTTYTGEIYSLDLQHTPFPPIGLPVAVSLKAPLTRSMDAYYFTSLPQIEKLDLSGCYYISGDASKAVAINQMIKKGLSLNAPFVFDKKNGILIGSVFARLDPNLRFLHVDEEEFNRLFFGKKITVEQGEGFKYLLADGKRVATYNEELKAITKLEIPDAEEFDISLIHNEHFQLEELSLPNTKRIMKGNKSYSYRFRASPLKKINVPQLESFVLDGVVLFENMKEKEINFDKERLKKNGIIFNEAFILDTKNQKIVPTTQKLKPLCDLINENIENARLKGVDISQISVEEKEGITSIFFNKKEMAVFDKEDLVRIDLPYVEKIEPHTFQQMPKLEEIKLDNVTEMGSQNLYSCPMVKRISFPHLKKMDFLCMNSLDSCEEIILPELEKMEWSCCSYLNPKKCKRIFLPSLEQASLDSCFMNKEIIPVETGYFERNNQHFFAGYLVDFEMGKLYPERDGRFSQMISKELKGAKISIEEKEDGRYLCADGHPVLREENNEITGIYIKKGDTVSLPYGFQMLKEVIAPNATKVSNYSFCDCPNLERVKLDNVTEIASNCFRHLPKLKELSLNKVEKIGEESFYSLSGLEKLELGRLKSCGNECFTFLDKIERLELNNLERCGKKCFSHMENMTQLTAVRLKELGADSLKRTPCLRHMATPLLANRLDLLKNHPNKRTLLKNMKKGSWTSHILYAGALAK